MTDNSSSMHATHLRRMIRAVGSTPFVLATAVVAIIGATLPWITVTTPAHAVVSRPGIAWDKGVAVGIMVVASAVAMAQIGRLFAGWLSAFNRYLGVTAAVAMIGLSAYAGAKVNNAASAAQAFPAPLTARAGLGLYLCGIAGIGLLVATLTRRQQH